VQEKWSALELRAARAAQMEGKPKGFTLKEVINRREKKRLSGARKVVRAPKGRKGHQ